MPTVTFSQEMRENACFFKRPLPVLDSANPYLILNSLFLHQSPGHLNCSLCHAYNECFLLLY